MHSSSQYGPEALTFQKISVYTIHNIHILEMKDMGKSDHIFDSFQYNCQISQLDLTYNYVRYPVNC